MSHVTVRFDDHEPYNRLGAPRGRITLKDKGGPHAADYTTWSLVDTGADHLYLPTQAASLTGLSLANAGRTRIMTTGGSMTMHRLDVDVEVLGVRMLTRCYFAPNVRPLIGRTALLKAVETAGFNSTEWLIEWKSRSRK